MVAELTAEIICNGKCKKTLVVRRDNFKVYPLIDPLGVIPTRINFIEVRCPNCGPVEASEEAQKILVSTFSLE